MSIAPDLAEVAALLRDLAECCPICATYRCAGHAPRKDCGHWTEVARHDRSDHRYCLTDDGCQFADSLRADVLAAGLPHATGARPLSLVALDGSGRPAWTGRTYADHRMAKPARTRGRGRRVRGQGQGLAGLRPVRRPPLIKSRTAPALLRQTWLAVTPRLKALANAVG